MVEVTTWTGNKEAGTAMPHRQDISTALFKSKPLPPTSVLATTVSAKM